VDLPFPHVFHARTHRNSAADDVVRAAPFGELDVVTAPALRSALEEAAALRAARIAVTLRHVTFLHSTASAPSSTAGERPTRA